MQITVECQKRPEGINPRALRRQGLIPAALYGHNGTESISLTLPEKQAYQLLKKASVNNTLIDLNIPEVSWTGKALIREVQTHPWKKTLYHLSFFSVGAQESVEVTVPLHITGEAAGVKKGGVLEQMMTEITVQCPPAGIPETIDVNVSDFEMGTNLHLGELVLPEGVVAIGDSEQMVFAIVAPAKVSETAELEEGEAILEA